MKKILILFSILSICLCGCIEIPNQMKPTEDSYTSEVSPDEPTNSPVTGEQGDELTEEITEDNPTTDPITPEGPTNDIVTGDELTEDLVTEELPTEDLATEEVTTEDSITEEKIELSTPVLVIDEITGIVTWDIIEGATHYNIIINDLDIISTTATTLTLNNESNVSVQAANESDVSDWSYAVTFFDTSDIEVSPVGTAYVYFHDANLEPIEVSLGETINKPNNPIKNNYEFDNWYSDPFGLNVFDFNEPILKDTIIYARYNPNNLIDNIYYWMKASPKIYSNEQSSTTSSSGWRFIPLHVNYGQTGYIEYSARITVTGASESDPAKFVVMDGFTDDSGRTYWKKGDTDFTIKSDGVYDIYFATEHKYDDYHIFVAPVNNSTSISANKLLKNTLATPIISVDAENNLAFWSAIVGALKYEVILNNGDVFETTETSVELLKGTHISVRAIGNTEVSNWSIPKANRGYILVDEEKVNAYVYFNGYDSLEVGIGETVNAPTDPTKDGFTFGGWYLDICYNTVAVFPYQVVTNTVFYPKWISDFDYKSKEFYHLIDSTGNKICGLTWNVDNFNFNEYQTPKVKLTVGKQYYIKSLDGTQKWGPYTVSTTSDFVIFFSEEYVWNIGTPQASNVHIESEKVEIFFSNNKGWSSVYIYIWNSYSNSVANQWPGYEMNYIGTNGYGEKIYSIIIDLGLYDYIIFTNNSGEQTKDISIKDVTTGTGYYLTGSNKYGVATYEYK